VRGGLDLLSTGYLTTILFRAIPFMVACKTRPIVPWTDEDTRRRRLLCMLRYAYVLGYVGRAFSGIRFMKLEVGLSGYPCVFWCIACRVCCVRN